MKQNHKAQKATNRINRVIRSLPAVKRKKFRAWHKDKKEMEIFDSLYELQKSNFTHKEMNNILFMECVGRQDINKKDVFECDIISNGRIMGIITRREYKYYENDGLVFYAYSENLGWREEGIEYFPVSSFEVLGNILENPELLVNKLANFV